MTSSHLRTGVAAAVAFLLVVTGYVVLHESLHVTINWLLAGEIATRCGIPPVVHGPNWQYVAVCYASGGHAGVNAAATLAISGLFGGAAALVADRTVRDVAIRGGIVAGAAGATVHLATYLLNTDTLAPGSGLPTDSATVIATIGFPGLLPAAIALLVSTASIATVSRRLWPAVSAVATSGTYATDGGRSGPE